MIRLDVLQSYWESVKDRVPELTGVMPVTIDEDMTKRIQSLPIGSVTLFWIPPTIEMSSGTVDSATDINRCVVFIMEKFSTMRDGSFDILCRTQPIIERIRELILADCRGGCSSMMLGKMSKVTILPETKFFAGYAGWSIGFTVIG